MIKRLVLLALCFLLWPVSLTAAQPVANEPEERLVPVNYEYSVTMEYFPENNKAGGGSVTGIESVNYRNMTGTALHKLCFNLYINSKETVQSPALTITNASVNGAECRFSVDGPRMTVFLPYVLEREQDVKVDILFEAKIGPDAKGSNANAGADGEQVWFGSFIPLLATFDRDEQQFRQASYYSAGKPVLSNIANFSVKVTTPIEYTVVGAGDTVVTENLTETGGKKTTAMTASMVRDFAFALGTGYEKTDSQTDSGLFISTNMYSDKNGEKARLYSDAAAGALEYFNITIGGYPYKSLKIIETGNDIDMFAYPQVIFINPGEYGENSGQDILPDIYWAVAKQWFYGVVGSNPVKEAWLSDGLSYYMARECSYGGDNPELDSYMRGLYDDLADRYDTLANVRLADEIGVYTSSGADYFDIQVIKAALMFHSLRSLLGTEAYGEFIRSYYGGNYLVMTTREHLRRAAEEAYGGNLGWFFDEWLDGNNLPAFKEV